MIGSTEETSSDGVPTPLESGARPVPTAVWTDSAVSLTLNHKHDAGSDDVITMLSRLLCSQPVSLHQLLPQLSVPEGLVRLQQQAGEGLVSCSLWGL